MPRALWTKAPFALLRHRVALLAVAAAAFLVATGAAAGPLMNAGAESEALQSKLRELTPLAAGLVIDRPFTGEHGALGAADRRRRAAARALAATLPHSGAPVLTTTSYAQIVGTNFDVGNSLLVVAMARTGAKAHVHVVDGGGAAGVWLSSALNGPTTLHVGRTVTFVRPSPASPAGAHVTLPLGAVYRQLDSDLANPYWVNFTARIRPPHVDSSLPPTFALVSPAQLYRLAHVVGDSTVGNDYEFPIDTRSMTPGRAKQVAASYRRVAAQIAARSALARRLGCADATARCSVTSELSAAVRLAAVANGGLTPVIDLLAGFCVAIACCSAVVAGLFTARRRAAEARLSLVYGESGTAFFARASVEAVLPAVLGAALGFALSLELVRLFTPAGAIDSTVVGQAAVRDALSVVATVVAIGLGTTAARGRLGEARARLAVLRHLPWELAALAGAVAAWFAVRSGGGIVRTPGAGAHPRLVVLLVPALVAAPVTGLSMRMLRTVLFRRVARVPVPAFLALRRVGAARGLAVVLTVTLAVAFGSFGFAQILRSSLVASSTEKALVSNGSDVQGVVDPAHGVPPGFPFPATIVAEAFDAGQLASGTPFEVLAVDPPSLARVLEPHWPRRLVDAVRALDAAKARLAAISVGVPRGTRVVTLGAARTTIDVVARVRAFPGMQPGQPLLVVPRRSLSRAPIEALTYVWATGPPQQVRTALARSSLAPSYLTALADFSRSPDVADVTRTYGFLRIVAVAMLVLALVALMLYLAGRARSQRITSAFLRRLGVAQRAQAWSVGLEAAVLVLVAAVGGVVAALVTSGVIVRHVDPLAAYAPQPVARVPWLLLGSSVVGAVVAAGVVAGLLALATRRTDVGEDLRIA